MPANESHRSFIISTWVKSYESFARKLTFGPAGLRIDHKAYRAGEARVAERFWQKSHVVVGEDDPYTIHGWVCADRQGPMEHGRLWHVYVPPALRLAGVATGLAQRCAGKQYCVSKPWPFQPRGHNVTYNPWMVME